MDPRRARWLVFTKVLCAQPWLFLRVTIRGGGYRDGGWRKQGWKWNQIKTTPCLKYTTGMWLVYDAAGYVLFTYITLHYIVTLRFLKPQK